MGRKLINKSFILWALFLVSFAPYILFVITAIQGVDTSLFYTTMTYGFGALKYMASILFIYVPICSVMLIWQIVYSILFLRKESSDKKKFAIVLVAVLAFYIIVPATYWEISMNNVSKSFKDEQYPKVEAYLNSRFSPEFVSKCELKETNPEYGYFVFSTSEPFFDGYDEFLVYVGDTIFTDMVDRLSHRSAFNGEFSTGLGEYVDAQYGIPDNQDLGVSIWDVDLTHYNYGDSAQSLYEYCDYRTISLVLNETEFDSDVISGEIVDFILCHRDLIQDDLPLFTFYVKVNGENYATVNVFPDNQNVDSYELRFTGYSDSNGVKTVENFDMQISLEG